jgi:hypothetical protein
MSPCTDDTTCNMRIGLFRQERYVQFLKTGDKILVQMMMMKDVTPPCVMAFPVAAETTSAC